MAAGMKGGKGLCFGKGLPPQGERVPFELHQGHLVLWPNSPREHPVPYSRIRLKPGGFEPSQFQFTWTDEDTPWVLSIDDPALVRSIRNQPPSALHQQIAQLESSFKKGHVRTGIGWAFIGALALLPILLVIGLWWQSDRIIDAVVDRIPVSWEERLGETTFAQITATEKIVSVGPAVQAVEAIGQRLISQVKSPYKLRLHVVDNPQVNAFALPGGHMVILTGLLRQAGSPEEVAGVLAHEVQHVVLRHSMRGLVQSLGWRAAFTILMGGTGPLSDMGEIASRLGSLKFGRDQETAADLGGLSLLHQAKVSPDGMIDFFNTLSGKEPGQIALLSTHPLSEERARRLQKQIRQMGEWPVEPFAISWPEVQAALERK